MRDTPQAPHSKTATSGRPLKREVLLASRIGCAQHGQRGGVSMDMGAFSSHMNRNRTWNQESFAAGNNRGREQA
jgi:hypothetical protein